jgi:hypothetical protein
VSPAGQEKVIPQNGKQRLIGYLLRDVEMDAACGPNTLTVSLPASKATIASRLSLTPNISRACCMNLRHSSASASTDATS